MQSFIVSGGRQLHGKVALSGAKNVALKAFVASLLTDEAIVIRNVPDIRDVRLMLDLLRDLGVDVDIQDHTVRLHNTNSDRTVVPLGIGARLRTSFLVMGPLLARKGRASIPNPGGCRIGARPIDRQIDAFLAMGADVSYSSDDGYFHGVCDGLSGTEITFTKNTHTGTEAVILAAVLARGKTVIRNAAAEIEIDDLIGLLNQMGADIVRTSDREVEIHGVSSLHGTEYQIMSDRNEEVTFAIAAAITGGEITVTGSQYRFMDSFLEPFSQAGGTYTVVGDGTVSYGGREPFRASDVMTRPYPGFMTDWQAPWALFMTQAKGVSTIHETIFESRFSYVAELKKMGARISFYDPPVDDPDSFYNFNWNDKVDGYHQAIRIEGPSTLHNAILEVHDLRAGATVLVAALTAEGESYITGVEQIDRGYEAIDTRLRALGAVINRHGGGNV